MSRLHTPTQESKLSTVCDGLLESVLGSLKPLLLGHTPDSAPSEARTLSPANETSVGLLLELALITGVTVSTVHLIVATVLIHYLHSSAFCFCGLLVGQRQRYIHVVTCTAPHRALTVPPTMQ